MDKKARDMHMECRPNIWASGKGDVASVCIGASRRSLARALFCAFAAIACAAALIVGLAPAIALAADGDEDGSSVEEKVATPVVSIEVAEEGEDGSLDWGEAADGQAGEWVSCRAIGTLPSNWDDFDAYSYAFYISLDSALEADASSVAVTLYDADGNELADLTDAAVVSCEDGELVVSFDDLKAAAPEASYGCTVVVSYDARLVAGLAEAGADGASLCYVRLEYSAEPGSDELGTSVEDSAALYTWVLSLLKVDADTGEALSGATFTIQDSDGHYIDLDGSLTGSAVEHETGEDGSFEVAGLDSGTYTITEVSAPEGYELAASFTLTISSDLDGEVVLSGAVEGEGASLLSVDADSGEVSVQADDEQSEEEAAGTSAGASSDSSSGGGIFAKTGDALGPVMAATLVVAIVAAVVVVAARRRKAAGAGAGGEEA